MDDEFSRVSPESIRLADEVLGRFDGEQADIAMPSLVVILTELISQVCSDRAEALTMVSGICDSVVESLKRCEELGPLSN
jgi:hypothetical protein